MKTILLSILLLLSATCPTALADNSCEFRLLPDARRQAKAEDKPMIILRHGSDWLHNDAELCAKWKRISTAAALKGAVFGQYDDVLGQDGSERNKVLPLESFDVPEVLVLDPDGTLMARLNSSQIQQRENGTIINALSRILSRQKKFTDLARRARRARGTEAAQLAGQALELLPAATAPRCRELTDIIRRHDAGNNTGYLAHFAMDHMAMYREINNRLKGGANGKLQGKDRDFQTALEYVQGVLRHKTLKGTPRQQWLCGLAYVHRERIRATGGTDWSPALDALEKAVRINPKNEIGTGAAKYHRYLDPNSWYEIEGDFYESGDQTLNFEKEWRVDVSKHIDGPGTYTFRLIPHDNGSLITRRFQLFINGKLVIDSPNPQRDTKSVDFTITKVSRANKVEVRLLAMCRDGWFGCSGEIRMEKKK